MEEYDTLRYHRREERKFLRGSVCCEMLGSLVLPPVPRLFRNPARVEARSLNHEGDFMSAGPRLEVDNRGQASCGIRHAETSVAKRLALPRLFGGLKQTCRAPNGASRRVRETFPTSHMHIS